MRILVTRAAHDAAALVRPLERAGHHVVCVPLAAYLPVAHAPTVLSEPADVTLLTSVRTVRALIHLGITALPGRIVAVGGATQEHAIAAGFAAECLPECGTGERLVAQLGDLSGQTVLYPRAQKATEATTRALQRAGAEIRHAIVYENRMPPEAKDRLADESAFDLAVVMAASAAQRLVETGLTPLPPVVAIGPSTADAAQQVGFDVVAVAWPHRVEGLLSAIEAYAP